MPKPRLERVHFEAALAPTGNAFTLNAEGEARLTLVVAESAAKPLAEAMASGVLRDTTFIVTITAPK